MGALHEGHLSLVRAAALENDAVAVSIFVNPAQFGPKEDFKKYPRPVSKDRALLREAGVDYVFLPSVKDMYGEGPVTLVEPPAELIKGLCGAFRPGHFRGVATVVAKLFNITGPCRAYFGLKDYQQVQVIRKMAEDLNFDVEIREMPTVREADGLAMSSRNQYLSPRDRRRALSLSGVLIWIRDEIFQGRRDLAGLKKDGLRMLRRHVDSVDYLEIVDPETLAPLKKACSKMTVAAAARLGKTRLIDNVIISL